MKAIVLPELVKFRLLLTLLGKYSALIEPAANVPSPFIALDNV